MTTRDLRRMCEAAEKQAKRRRSAEQPAFIVRVMRQTSGSGLSLTPRLDEDQGDAGELPSVQAEIEAAGDGEEFETLARFSCQDVRLFLQRLAAVVEGDVELRTA